jgi:hypothetical protein
MGLKKKLDIGIRLALVQLQCHEAATVGGKDYLGEPFVDRELPLDGLIRCGLRQFDSLREDLAKDYLSWHKLRLESVLDYIGSLSKPSTLLNHDGKTSSATPILILSFPEYSIPFQLLPVVHDWIRRFSKTKIDESRNWSVAVFAGTHTLPPPTKENLQIYKDVGYFWSEAEAKSTFTSEFAKRNQSISEQEVNERVSYLARFSSLESLYQSPLPTKAVAPVFYSDQLTDDNKIRSWVRIKRILSPFELTNMGIHTDEPEKIREETVQIPVRMNKHAASAFDMYFSVLPLICSEALQSTAYGDVDYDMVIIPAYNKSSIAFEPVIEQLSRNQRLVVLSNDGLFGGSCFALPPTDRGDSWWLGAPNHGKLPPGDGLVVADITPLNLAEAAKVNNPVERCQMLRISAIVPRNIDVEPCVISKALDRLRSLETERLSNLHSRDGGNALIDVERRRGILLECLERNPTPIQQRKLNRLLALSHIDRSLWDLHASDVYYPFKSHDDLAVNPGTVNSVGHADVLQSEERIKLSPQQPPLPKSFANLENWFARRCIARIEEVREANELLENQHRELTNSLRLCKEKLGSFGDKEYESFTALPSAVRKSLRSISKSHHEFTQRALNEFVADIVERYRAASAWLFVNVDYRLIAHDLYPETNNFPLKCIVAHNGLICAPLSSQGSLAARCLAEMQTILYRDIQIRQNRSSLPFLPLKQTTRSAVAVPIRSPCTINVGYSDRPSYDGPMIEKVQNKIVGILVLESSEPSAFGPAQASQLEFDTAILAPSLAYRRNEVINGKGANFWNPLASNWQLTPILNQLCDDVARAIPAKSAEPYFGMTIWRTDIARQAFGSVEKFGQELNFAYELYALGFVRFDAEYIAQQTLPWFLMNNTIPKRPQFDKKGSELLTGSFVGDVAYSKSDGYRLHDWRISDKYRRQEKGRRTELDMIVGVKLAARDRKVFPALDTQLTSECHDAEGLESHLNECLGALTFYAYSGTSSKLLPFLSKTSVVQASELISKFVLTAMDIRIEFALAQLRARQLTESLTDINAFNVLRDFLMELFDADGCSIFALERENRVVVCVTTSGIEANGKEINREKVSYTAGSGNHVSAALFAKDAPNCLRANSRTDHFRKSPPVHRFVEAFVLTWLEHRRSLICRVSGEDGHLGVIRIIRSVSKQPFTPDDELLIGKICENVQNEFRNRRKVKQRSSDTELETWAGQLQKEYKQVLEWERECSINENSPVADSDPMPAEKDRAEVYKETCKRLAIGDPSRLFCRRQIESIIQDVFFAFDDLIPVLAVLRVAMSSERGTSTLKVFSYHAHSSRSLSEDNGDHPVSYDEGGIGWETLKTHRAIEFGRSDLGFTELFPFQKNVSKGICAPIVLPFANGVVAGCISVEWFKKQNSSERHLDLLTRASIQMAICASGQTRSVQSDWLEGSLEELVENSFQTLKMKPELVGKPSTSDDFQTVGSRPLTHVILWNDRLTPESLFGDGNLSAKSHNVSEIARMNDGQFSPLAQLRHCTDREFQANACGPNSFGRLDLDLVGRVREIQNVGVRLDLEHGLLSLPLWAGTATLGHVFVRYDWHGIVSTSHESYRHLMDQICQVSHRVFVGTVQWLANSKKVLTPKMLFSYTDSAKDRRICTVIASIDKDDRSISG